MDRNRTFFITFGSFTVLTLIGAAHVYEDKWDNVDTHKADSRPPVVQTETRPRTVDDLIKEALPGIDQGAGDPRAAAVGNLLEELASEEYSKASIPSATGEALAKSLAAFAGELDASQENAEMKVRVAGLLASRTNTPSARAYVERVLESGTAGERLAVFSGISARGGLRGKRIYTKILDLKDKNLVPQELLPVLLRRTGGKDAVEPLLVLMKSTDSRKIVGQCAVALEDYRKPELMGAILERLDQLGMLGAQRAQLPWIDRAVFASHMEKADGIAFTRGLKLMSARPSLIKGNAKAVERGLESLDPANRQYAALTIKKAVGTKNMDPKEGSALLAKRLDRETEPVLRTEITGGLELARQMMEPSPETAQP